MSFRWSLANSDQKLTRGTTANLNKFANWSNSHRIASQRS